MATSATTTTENGWTAAGAPRTEEVVEIATTPTPTPTPTSTPYPAPAPAQLPGEKNAVLLGSSSNARPPSLVEYSVFTESQKRWIVFTASWAGFFSPVSSQIYFPALNTLARDLQVTDALINLTITSYMVSGTRARALSLSSKMLKVSYRSSKAFLQCLLATLQIRQGGGLHI